MQKLTLFDINVSYKQEYVPERTYIKICNLNLNLKNLKVEFRGSCLKNQ